LTRSRILPVLATIFALLSTPWRAEATRRRVNSMLRLNRLKAGQQLAKASCWIALALLSTLNLQPSTFAQGTAFTYSGQLQNNGSPANGLYDFQCILSNAPDGSGSQLGSTITTNAIAVT